MHLISCRQSTSGLAALMNLATRSMRSRTELIFQVVRDRRMRLTRRGRVIGEVDLEQALIDLLRRIQVVDRDRGFIAIRNGQCPLHEFAVLGSATLITTD